MESVSEFCAVKSEFSNSVTSVEQFNEICRCCLSADHEICSIFKLQYNENSFSDLLHSCTSIHVRIYLLIQEFISYFLVCFKNY